MPGVPPNALHKLKQALKGMLKPGGKKRQDQQEQPPQQETQQQDKTDGPPQIPPTHTLGAGKHEEEQAAAPLAAEFNKSTTSVERAAKDRPLSATEDKPKVSPIENAPDAKPNATNEPVSAVSADSTQSPVAKPDGAGDDGTTATAQAPTQPTSSENVKPAASTASAPEATAAQPAAKASSEQAPMSDEKVPVTAEEPPKAATNPSATGMSATSGPLEDFPAQEDKP